MVLHREGSSSSGVPVCRLIALENCRPINRGLQVETGDGGEDVAMDVVGGASAAAASLEEREVKYNVAPELVAGQVIDWTSFDVWSLGVMLYILLTGTPLYHHPNDPSFELLKSEGAAGLINFYAKAYGLRLSSVAEDLVSSMLRPDPLKRPTLDEIVNHPFIQAHGPYTNRSRRLATDPIVHQRLAAEDPDVILGRHWRGLTRNRHSFEYKSSLLGQ